MNVLLDKPRERFREDLTSLYFLPMMGTTAFRGEHTGGSVLRLQAVSEVSANVKGIPLLIILMAWMLALGSCNDTNPVTPGAQPMDTTSHTYVWEIDTLVMDKYSRVNGVWAFSENDVWVVGYFRSLDSTGAQIFNKTCNAAHWDGQAWRLHRVDIRHEGQSMFGAPTNCFGLSPDDFWLVPGLHWNGYYWTGHDFSWISNGQTLAAWGSRTDDVYFVGRNESIVRWDGKTLTSLAAETSVQCHGVWGSGDTVLIATVDGYRVYGGTGHIIRVVKGRIIGREAVQQGGFLSKVWECDGIWYAGGSAGIFSYNGKQWQMVMPKVQEVTGLQGTALNDVYVSYYDGRVHHFNGRTWKFIRTDRRFNFMGTGLAAVGWSVFITAADNGYPIVMRGRRVD